MRDTTDELNAAEVDSTNLNDMFTVSVSNSNLKHHGHHSGAKPGVSLSAAESSHASVISRTPKGRQEVKDAHNAPVSTAKRTRTRGNVMFVIYASFRLTPRKWLSFLRRVIP